MKALVIRKTGGPEVLKVEDWPKPYIKNNQVLIRVKAAGVNFADCIMRMGLYRDAPPRPFVPGYEVAGVVEEVGQGVTEFKKGDRVVTPTRFGGCCEFVAVDAVQPHHLPDSISFEEAAAIPVNYMTAYVGLYEMGRIREGDKVLIHNAAGGVGTAAVQLVQAAKATVIATAGSPQKIERLKAMGVQHIVNYRFGDYEENVRRLLAGKISNGASGAGLQISFNALGGDTIKKDLRLLGPGGRVIIYGMASFVGGEKTDWLKVITGLLKTPIFHPLWLANNNKGVFGLNMLFYFNPKDPAYYRRVTNDLMSLFHQGKLKPIVDSTYPLEKAPEAHHRIHSRQSIGKVVLIP